jgi:Ca2+-binding RTX toxin-like protein
VAISYKGTYFGGNFSDYLPAGQIDSFSVNLAAGTTYYLGVTSATVPIDFALSGPQGPVKHNEFVGPGQILSYTPSISGAYGIGIDTATGAAGAYTITGGDAVVALTDTTQGQTSNPFMTTYTGPVAGLTHQFIDISADNLNITAATPSVFLHSGAGEDALQVNSGNNILDGSTGSNFLVGGSGNDTFFADTRGAQATIWDTLVHFHAGDAATIWGVTQAGSQFTYADNQGAAGYTGLTVMVSATGKPNALLTLPGYTTADVTSGRLSTLYGFDPASRSSYVYIHGDR